MSENAILIPFFVVVPLAGAFLIALLGRRFSFLPDMLGTLVTLTLLGLSLAAVQVVNFDSVQVYPLGGWKAPIGITLVMDGLTSFMLATMNVVAFCIAIYARDYMEGYTSKGKFYSLFLLMLAGMNGVVVTGDIFNLFVFLEIAAVSSYALVAFGTERHSLEAAFKYAVMGTIGSLFILLGIVLLYGLTSTLNMADMSHMLSFKKDQNLILMVCVLFLMGFGLKSALVPFHAWLPDAHPSAPAPISAMLSGILIKSLGIYALIRIFFHVIGMTSILSSILMALGVLSMMVGVLLAIGQWDLKRLLAYHSISQIGYVVFAIGLGTPLGLMAGLFHLFNHSIFKSLLFLNSGAVEYATGTRDLKAMGGLQKKMPVTAGTCFVASMSIAGIPPFNGFWSKLLIIIAAVKAGHLIYAIWAVLASILTLASFMKVMKYAFLGELRKKWQDVREVPVSMQGAMISLALICLLGGVLLLSGIEDVFLKPASMTLVEGFNYSETVLKDQ